MAKQLKFKCPKCGGDEIVSIETSVESYRIDSITDDLENPIEFSDKYDMVDHWKDRFQCRYCNLIVGVTEDEVVAFIKKNCPQE